LSNWLSKYLVAAAALAAAVELGKAQDTNVKFTESTTAYIPQLAKAVILGDTKQVSKLLEQDQKAVNDRVLAKPGARAGFTPLILAAALSEPDIVHLLILSGAEITLRDDYNRSAVWYAALRSDVSMTKALFEAKNISDVVNIADDDFKRTPLHLAAQSDDVAEMDLLVSRGATNNTKDYLGKTPAEYCGNSIAEVCKKILQK
jgi:ankyrin repeat protein